MNDLKISPKEKASNAFINHMLVRIQKTSGQILEPGYITIMYGEVAFRVQPKFLQHDSQFIRVSEIEDILIEQI